MQDRYAGDIGDFVKLALLRSLATDCTLGLAWWLYPDESHNGDGRHIGYLDRPDEWRHLDPELFSGLFAMVRSGVRNVAALHKAASLTDARHHLTVLPIDGSPRQRSIDRQAWFASLKQRLAECDFVFIDPDNGLEPSRFSFGSRKAGKSVTVSELLDMAIPGRTLVVYHHHTRRKGGHEAELGYWADRLREAGFHTVDALRSRPYSPRAFFLLNAPSHIRQRGKIFSERWEGLVSWHPDSQKPMIQ